jgi:HD superfamily phosphohydrolase
MKKFILSILLTINFSFFLSVKPLIYEEPIENGKKFESLYGKHIETDKAILEIIDSKPMQRLKHIYQGGPSHFVVPFIVYRAKQSNSYTRYDHSIGTMILVSKLLSKNKSFSNKEKRVLKIAALIHDISHGLLSHVIDLVRIQGEKNPILEEAYQDKILETFLINQKIDEILTKYEITIEEVIPSDNNPNYNVIKQSHGQLCIDTIEYTISECYLTGILKKGHIRNIISNLNYNKDIHKWYFTDTQIAEKFGNASINLVNLNSGSLWNVILYNLSAMIIKDLINTGKLNENDISYSKTDNQFWFDLNDIYRDDSEYINYIMTFIDQMQKREKTFIKLDEKTESSKLIVAKFRATDPYIKIGNEIKFLSEINQAFKEKFIYKKKNVTKGRLIEFINKNHPLTNREIIAGC